MDPVNDDHYATPFIYSQGYIMQNSPSNILKKSKHNKYLYHSGISRGRILINCFLFINLVIHNIFNDIIHIFVNCFDSIYMRNIEKEFTIMRLI